MSRETEESSHKKTGQRQGLSLTVVILNIVLLWSAILLFGRYAAVFQEQLRAENLGNIANLNQSAAINATALIDSWDVKLQDIVRYVSRHGMTHGEALAFIDDSSSGSDRQFQLIGGDYTGYLARRDEEGGYPALSYAKDAYKDLQKSLDDRLDAAYGDVCFAPEFTDSATALKYFAVYRHLPLKNEMGGEEIYTLLLAAKSSDLVTVFNSQNGFTGQSTVLMDPSGNYIVRSMDFKSTNFFQYLYVYNDLTLDQRNAVAREIQEKGSGELYYQNAAGQDCVFRYSRMATNGWYCVTCVPISSFRTPTYSLRYALYAVVALVLMLGLDVAWLQHMNRRLKNSVLREKEAGEAKTDFLSRMSHDIRTPLNGIIGLTALAMDEENPPATREYLDKIKVSGQFLTGLVNDILDLSKVERGKVELHPEPYACEDLSRYVEAVVSPLCREKGLEFRISLPEDTSPVLLDRLRFNQVMFNLLSNAVKYTPRGGLVELDWKRTDLTENRVALDFTVRDNGIGMSEEFQRHMFESFTQENAQTATTGAGLGLAIVQSLVRLMNGRISVQSKQGEGSAFTVHLETDACGAAAATGPAPDGDMLRGKRVLLCEDNAINTLVVERMLGKWGMTVDAAENGREGVERFSASGPGEYSLILMDVMMPEMDGMEATRRIRAMGRPDAGKIPILAMTANAYDTDVRNCLNAGMNAHMGKPVDPERLRELLCRLLGDAAGAAG